MSDYSQQMFVYSSISQIVNVNIHEAAVFEGACQKIVIEINWF